MENTTNIQIRHLQSFADYAACVELQKETWGEYFSEIVPPTILMVSQKIGGLAAGAFTGDGEMVGFVFGQTGFLNGNLINWSQMLAVKQDHRGAGLGWKLKLFQRDFCLQHGIEYVYWTYDPLVARNAHLNLNKLGANIDNYVEDFYPEGNDSVLHQGMPLDRFIVEWRLKDEHVLHAIAGTLRQPEAVNYPVVNTVTPDCNRPQPTDSELAYVPAVRIEIPKNIEQIQSESLEFAARWRLNTRRVFTSYLNRGYRVAGFYAEDERCFYILKD